MVVLHWRVGDQAPEILVGYVETSAQQSDLEITVLATKHQQQRGFHMSIVVQYLQKLVVRPL